MKKTILLLLVIFLLNSCSLHDDYIVTSNFAGEIMQKRELDLTHFDKFDWDSLIILGPYTDPQKVSAELGLDLSNINGDLKGDDTYNLIIFLKNKKSVKISELNRRYGGFNGFYKMIIPKNKARFILKGNLNPSPLPNLELEN